MNRNIAIEVRDKVATAPTDAVIICGNSDYSIVFTFDDEWDGLPTKTARFKYFTDAGRYHIDVLFTGDSVAVPVLTNTRRVEVGVFAGDLASTTGAAIRCEPCIRCGSDAPTAPDSNVYDQIMESLNSGALQGPPGEDGKDGENGKDGDSAYQVAVNNGFEGTEQEWLESLKGEDGEDGEGGGITDPNILALQTVACLLKTSNTFAAFNVEEFSLYLSSYVLHGTGTLIYVPTESGTVPLIDPLTDEALDYPVDSGLLYAFKHDTTETYELMVAHAMGDTIRETLLNGIETLTFNAINS